MKNKIVLLIVLMFTGTSAFSQTKSKSSMASWPELKEFHTVMSQTFHPSEEGNLEPIKTRATEMKEKAMALASSKVPAEFDNSKIKDAVNRLKDGTMTMEKMVDTKVDDKQIASHLNSLHDIFHEIVGLCRGEDHGDGKKEGTDHH